MINVAILVALSLVPAAVRGQAVYRQNDGAAFVRDGIVNLEGFSGTVFQVINYMPVCGSLSSSLTRQIDLSDKCTAAMSSFNTSTTLLTAAIYDLSGIPTSTLPGSGIETCVCGAFGTSAAGGQNNNGLICVWVDEKGFEEEWWSLSTDTRVASSFQLSAQAKALPQCKDVNIASLSSASFATRTVDISSSPTSKATSTAGSGKSGSGTTQGSPTSTGATSSDGPASSSNQKPSQALSTPAIIGLSIAAVIVVISVTAAVICYRRARRPSLTPSSLPSLKDDQSSRPLYNQRPNSADGGSSAWVGVAEWNSNVRR